jgi:hypothetical protein
MSAAKARLDAFFKARKPASDALPVSDALPPTAAVAVKANGQLSRRGPGRISEAVLDDAFPLLFAEPARGPAALRQRTRPAYNNAGRAAKVLRE